MAIPVGNVIPAGQSLTIPRRAIEIDGASNNGVEDVRRLLADAGTFGMFDKKVIVIDEAHMLSKSAFNALLITLENPPEHCIFILCTTRKKMLCRILWSPGRRFTHLEKLQMQ